ncbi:signal peptidase I [Thermococcus bergensis]|jgi:signal peptidase|uniref:signal peptidase I n=1 Tax=Thermococcus bergensis TaxID=2689387 RepID=UPI001CEC1D4D|nr:signal peptidase I [Thermococcus bergensis]MCA6213725.1 signal peptidase I [Thermococcus bergensis]
MRVKYLVLLVLLLPVFLLLPYSGNLELLVVLSGSMQPLFNPGDVIVVERVNASSIAVGDVVAFRPPDAKDEKILVTHRVVEILVNESGRYFQTRGDNNEDVDPFLVPAENVVGKAIFSIPYLGYLTRHNHSRTARLLVYIFLIFIPGVMLIYGEIYYLMHYSPRIERMKEKDKRRRARTVDVVFFKRVLGIFLVIFTVTTVLFHPLLEEDNNGITNKGFLPVLVLRNDVPNYSYLSPGEIYGGNYEVAVNAALPVMWIVRAYEINPFIVKSLNVILSLLLTLIMFPLWVKEFPNVKNRRRRRHHGTLGI